ncbi:hypothetical protein F5Y18DRAFT_379177 [Xylariaceae sp. FL1019]|nr:hypothetical protein F5Y18DRAFT_379177 [Xylariaceae sp. FL1019]
MLHLLAAPLLATLSVGQGIQWNMPFQNATQGVSPILCNKTFVVQQGDTCEKICVFKGLSLVDFLKANPEVSLKPNGSCPLHVDQTVCVDKEGRTRLTTSSLSTLAPSTSDFSSTSTVTVTPTETIVITLSTALTSASTPAAPGVSGPSLSSSSSAVTVTPIETVVVTVSTTISLPSSSSVLVSMSVSSPGTTQTDVSSSVELPLPQPETSISFTESPEPSDTDIQPALTSLHVVPAPHPAPDTDTESNHVIPVPNTETTPTDVHVIPGKNSPTGVHVVPVAKPSIEQRNEANAAEEPSQNKRRGLWNWFPSTFRTSTRDAEAL